MSDAVFPIGAVARRFGVRASALRYYEDIGLLKPLTRRPNGRYYGPAELKRLVLIQLLQNDGRLSLQEIAGLLSDRSEERRPRDIVNSRIAKLDEQIRTAEAAKRCLEHVLSCPRDDPFDGCPVLAGTLEHRLTLRKS